MSVSPDELGARLTSLVAGAEATVSFTQLTVDVPLEQWHDAAVATRDDAAVACAFFDWLLEFIKRNLLKFAVDCNIVDVVRFFRTTGGNSASKINFVFFGGI